MSSYRPGVHIGQIENPAQTGFIKTTYQKNLPSQHSKLCTTGQAPPFMEKDYRDDRHLGYEDYEQPEDHRFIQERVDWEREHFHEVSEQMRLDSYNPFG